MEIYVKKLFALHTFYFLFSISILIYMLVLHVSQLQTQQLMTSQIRSDIEHLIQTCNILVLFSYQY